MKAVIVRQFGGPEALEIIDTPRPEVGPMQLGVRVSAAAVNPVDVGTRAGAFAQLGMMPATGQVGIGWDVAGVVDEVGAGVGGFAQGDTVIGLRDLISAKLGTYAEFVVIDASAVAHAPRSATPAAAATLPLNGLTALQALDALDLPAGASLLVTGAAGAVGGFTVELAAMRGLRVVALAAREDERLVRQLGADDFVARSEGELAVAVRGLIPGGVDAVVDAAALGAPALDAVRGGGRFAALAPNAVPLPLRGTRVELVLVRADGVQLGQLAALVDAGRLTLRVASTHDLHEVAVTHELMARGGTRGRFVLEPAA